MTYFNILGTWQMRICRRLYIVHYEWHVWWVIKWALPELAVSFIWWAIWLNSVDHYVFTNVALDCTLSFRKNSLSRGLEWSTLYNNARCIPHRPTSLLRLLFHAVLPPDCKSLTLCFFVFPKAGQLHPTRHIHMSDLKLSDQGSRVLQRTHLKQFLAQRIE